jgi:hypothetical protein
MNLDKKIEIEPLFIIKKVWKILVESYPVAQAKTKVMAGRVLPKAGARVAVENCIPKK